MLPTTAEFFPATRPLTLPRQYYTANGAPFGLSHLVALWRTAPALGTLWYGGPLLRCHAEIPPHALLAAGLCASDDRDLTSN